MFHGIEAADVSCRGYEFAAFRFLAQPLFRKFCLCFIPGQALWYTLDVILAFRFIMETGFDGSLWVCLEEFLQTEFQDPGYMMGLIDLMDDHEEMWKFYREHYIPEKQEYYVTMKVEGRFITKVLAETIKEAKELAVSEYENADFGKLEDIDGDCIIVEDADGDYVWETGDPDPEE